MRHNILFLLPTLIFKNLFKLNALSDKANMLWCKQINKPDRKTGGTRQNKGKNVKDRQKWPRRRGLYIFAALWMLIVLPLSAVAAPFAALVMDARTGEVLYSSNADTQLHPASLTKMMTLYVAFEAIENGEITLDTPVRISSKAASKPPSKLGLKAGQKIKLRYLIRASAVKSANDAATAIGEAIEGSEAAFARRMNRTAKAMGMTRTHFKNMSGLTESGHLSTARDMTILGRQLFYDFPQYYNLFSRRQTDAGVRTVYNTNRKLLSAYKGADGIKTGYTSAAGFNLVASAERNGERIIATVFGGRSSNARNAKVAELLDLGFKRAPRQVTERPPRKPNYQDPGARSLPMLSVVRKSLRPKARPGSLNTPAEAPMLVAEMKDDIKEALREAVAAPAQPAPSQPAPEARQISELIETSLTPRARPQDLQPDQAATPDQPEVVSRVSTSGGRHWGINVGKYNSRHQAERILLKTALLEVDTLDGSLRRVVKQNSGYAANFLGMSQETADLACRRLQARKLSCTTIGPPPG